MSSVAKKVSIEAVHNSMAVPDYHSDKPKDRGNRRISGKEYVRLPLSRTGIGEYPRRS